LVIFDQSFHRRDDAAAAAFLATTTQDGSDFGPPIGFQPIPQFLQLLLDEFQPFEPAATLFRIGIRTETLFHGQQRIGGDFESVIEEQGREERDPELEVSGEVGRDGTRSGQVRDRLIVISSEQGTFCAEESKMFGLRGQGDRRGERGETAVEEGRRVRERFPSRTQFSFGVEDFRTLPMVTFVSSDTTFESRVGVRTDELLSFGEFLVGCV
jgi:hypothetical protein